MRRHAPLRRPLPTALATLLLIAAQAALAPPARAAATAATAATADTAAPAASANTASPANIPRLRALNFAPFAPALDALPAARIAVLDALLRQATIPELQTALRASQLSATELTLYFLHRTRRLDEQLRTLVELNPRALDEARAADVRRQAGRLRGPMDGIPVTLKDNIETAGPMHTTAGAELLLDHVARRDAPLVARLRAAGAVILGKANLSEWAGVVAFGPRVGGNSAVGGQTINPHGVALTGGSSAGSAAGTAARLTMVSVGSETSGSLISPASWNGVVGMKPSRGQVSGEGVIPLISNNDSAGPIGRSVTDVALLLGAVTRQPGQDFSRHLRADALDGVAVGVLATDISQADGNTAPLQAASATLAAAGARLRPVALGPTPPALAEGRFMAFIGAGLRHDTMGYVASLGGPVKTLDDLLAYNAAQPQRRQPFGADLMTGLAQASAAISATDYAAMAQAMRRAATAQLDAAFASKQVQVLVSFENMHATLYATAGYPAITVPLGLRTRGGLAPLIGAKGEGVPLGITFIGKPGQDARLLGVAFAFEQATRLRVEPGVK